MIIISKPWKEITENNAYLMADVRIPDSAAQAWIEFSKSVKNDFSYIDSDYLEYISGQKIRITFKVDKVFYEGLCTDRMDAFIAAMLYYAMVVGEDIESEGPVSEELLFKLNYILIPTLCNKETGFKKILINAKPIRKRLSNKGYVGTGMSCGIDSLHTMWLHTQADMYEDYRLTHLTYFNVGSDRNIDYKKETSSLNDFNREAETYRIKKISVSKKVSAENSLGFIFVDSNISDIYQGLFEHSFVYRTLAAALSMQGFWKRYFLSSAGHNIDVYTPSLLEEPGSYDKLISHCLSTENISFVVAGADCTRIDKTKSLVDDPISQKYLNVCSKDIHCMKCTKCYRTALTLDLLDALNEFRQVFDLEKYSRIKHKAYAWMLSQKRNSHANQVYELYKNIGGSVPIKTYPYLLARNLFKLVNSFGGLRKGKSS